MVIDRFETLLPSTPVPTYLWIFLSFLNLSTPSPYEVKLLAHYLHLSHAPHHIRNIKMSSSLLAEEFGLRPVVSLPSLAERMIHSEIGKVIILKVEVVEVITRGLDLLSLEDPH